MAAEQKFLSYGYEIYEQLGEGGGGSVYRAWHKNLQKEVVIKKIHDRFKDSEKQRSEVDILKNLRHSYIPQVFDYFEVDGIGYTVMDFVPGDSIGNYLKQGRKFSEKQIMKYAVQLCEAVAYLHEQRIPVIHGDIKPDNIMLKPDDNICLIDFNISGISDDGTAETSGYTPGYGAPEQYIQLQKLKQYVNNLSKSEQPVNAGSADDKTEILSGSDKTEILSDDKTEVCNDIGEYATEILGDDATEVLFGDGVSHTPEISTDKSTARQKLPMIKIDKRSDVYSIGATIYRLYTGKTVDQGDATVKGGKSDAFINILNKALSNDPAKRYQSAGDMLKALMAIHKNDKRYRKTVFVQNLIKIILVLCMAAGIGLIYLGMQTKEKERYDAYDEYVNILSKSVDSDDRDSFEEAYNSAVELFPEKIEPYYYKSIFLYNQKEYEDDIYYIEDEALIVSDLYYQEYIDEIYATLAGCYYELDYYQDAAANYATAIKYDDTVADYYVNYAFALAKKGDTKGAKEAIETAKEMGADDGYIYLAEGEIKVIESDYESSLEDFYNCLDNTDTDYTVLRAYFGIADAYDGLISSASDDELPDLYGEEINVLSEAEKKVADEYADAIRERLAQAAIDAAKISPEAGYDEIAIDTLLKIADGGLATFDNYYSLVNLYLTAEKYEDADTLVKQMESLFPDNYRVYKSGAIIQVQLLNAGTVNDYSDFKYYYETAVEKYEDEEIKNDSQMEQLEEIYNELVSQGLL